MLNTAKKKIRGPALVTAGQLRSAFALADYAVAESVTPSTKDYMATKVYVYLRDETYVLDNVDDALNVPNRNSNRIERMRIKSGLHDPSLSISVGSYYIGRTAAEIEVTGLPSRNQHIISEFSKIFDIEKDTLLSFLSINPIIIAFF